MHRLATELHDAQCTVACTATMQCTAQHRLGHSQNASSFSEVTLAAVIAEQVSLLSSVAAGQPHKQCTDSQLSCPVHSGVHSLSALSPSNVVMVGLLYKAMPMVASQPVLLRLRPCPVRGL